MPRNLERKLAKFEPPPPVLMDLAASTWWQDQWRRRPSRRNEFDDDQPWPLDLLVAGPLAPLQRRLQAAGWRVQPQAGWQQALQLLDYKAQAEQVPVLPATLDTQVESLLMLRPGPRPDEMYTLRLWPAPARLQPRNVPLWLGSAQSLRYERHFNLIGLWRSLRGADPALNAVTDALHALPTRRDMHRPSDVPVLLVRSESEAPATNAN